MADGWSPHEAADRLLCAEATVRRRVTSGDLKREEGPGPLRITRASVEAAQADMLRRMGVTGPAPQGGQRRTEIGADAEVDRLRQQLRDLRGALADLTAAHAAVLDTYRRLSEGAIPND